MIVILAIQCLFFADGGLMALGANIWNMAFYGCFVGYYLIWRPIIRSNWFGSGKAALRGRIIAASIIGCIVTLQLGRNLLRRRLHQGSGEAFLLAYLPPEIRCRPGLGQGRGFER